MNHRHTREEKGMGTSLRVLIVEDSDADTRLLLRELRKGGYDPTWERVETSEAMCRALERQTWDVVLADYTMPRFSAPEALNLLQASGLDIPFIVVSGTIGEERAVEMMKAGAHDYILKGNLTRLAPAMTRELREVEMRWDRRRLAAAQQEFFRKTIEAATEGKLLIRDREEILRIAGPALVTWTIASVEALGEERHAVEERLMAGGMDTERVADFVLCISEAITNAFKHAGGDSLSLHRTADGFLAVITDHGKGIPAINLPELALTRGYTTAHSLGMGYKAMLMLADTVYLATGPDGTIVGIVMACHPPPHYSRCCQCRICGKRSLPMAVKRE